jgi:hypothetical protein
MLNTLALSFRPEEIRLFIAYLAAAVSALLALVAGWLRVTVASEDRRGVPGPIGRVLASAFTLSREAAAADRGARMECRWVRDEVKGLVCRWKIGKPIRRRSRPASSPKLRR